MKAGEWVVECRCQHLRSVHHNGGQCVRCACTRYRRDRDRYPLGLLVVTS